MCKISAKNIEFYDSWSSGFLEIIEVWLNLGIGFCITFFVPPNYKKLVRKNQFWVNHASHLNILMAELFSSFSLTFIRLVTSPLLHLCVLLWYFSSMPQSLLYSTQYELNLFTLKICGPCSLRLSPSLQSEFFVISSLEIKVEPLSLLSFSAFHVTVVLTSSI